MDYVIFDLEWNQSSTKEGEIEGFPFEIIEIGAIKLNRERQMVGQFGQLIRPQVYREMNHITRKLIHLQMEELEKGRPFPEVMEEFLGWCGEDVLFCTWGPSDLTELQRNMEHYGMPPLAGRPFMFYDVQKLFSIAYEDRKSRRSLEYAIDFLELPKDIPFHRAFSDAYYTAKIFASVEEGVLTNYSFDLFEVPGSRKEEIHIVFDTYAKYISREFADKAAALSDREVMGTKCYVCGKSLRKKIKWFTPNGKHYYCAAYCDEHGYMKAKVRLRKSRNDKVYVVKTTKLIAEEEMKALRQKQESARAANRRRNPQSG